MEGEQDASTGKRPAPTKEVQAKKARSCKSAVAQKNQMQVIKATAASGPSRKL